MPVMQLVAAGRATERSPERMDARTFADVVNEYSTPLLRYVSRLTLNDRDLAEDIVQEALLLLWQRPRRLRGGHRSVRAWLLTVARNLVQEHRRDRVPDSVAMRAELLRLRRDHRAVAARWREQDSLPLAS